MKKQILIFAMLTLAIVFAGTNNVFGQTYIKHVEAAAVGNVGCVTAAPLDCATAFDELHPNPGQNYIYTIQTDPTAVDAVHWFVTTDPAIITAGLGTLTTTRDVATGGYQYILATEDGDPTGEDNVYNNDANTDKSINISWQYFDASATDVLLVAYVTGASGCSDNIEVWKIEPAFSFTLDVLSMSNIGAVDNTVGADPASECVSPVESADYNTGSPGTLTVDYGENWVFFSVNAANFVDSWKFTTLSATATYGSVGTIEWAYADQAIIDNGTGTWNDMTVAVDASASAVDGVVGSSGECIVVRVQVDHGPVENPVNLETSVVELSINGIMYDSANDNYTNTDLADVDDDGTDCVQDITDTATSILTARPLITEVNPTPALGPFVPKNP